MTSIRRLSFENQGRAFEGFFGLANGIERTAKLILVTDHYANTGSFPGPKQLKAFGHDLTELVRHVEKVSESWNVAGDSSPSRDEGSESVITFLTRFALTDRYFNLNRLSQGDASVIDDPLSRWVALVKRHAPSPRKIRRVEEEQREVASRLDARLAIQVNFAAMSGDRINSLESATIQAHEDEWVGVQGVLLAVRPLRFLARTIGRLNNVREPVPFYSEIFFDWLAPDSVLRKRRGFPRGRN